MAPWSSTAGGMVLLHSIGFSTTDYELVQRLSAILQFPLINMRHYCRLTRVARVAFFCRGNMRMLQNFSVGSIRSSGTPGGIPVMNLPVAPWVLFHHHTPHHPLKQKQRINGLTD